MENKWTENDINKGLGLIMKLELVLDDLNYFETKNLFYKTLKNKSFLVKQECEKHIRTFFNTATEEVQLHYYEEIKQLELKLSNK